MVGPSYRVSCTKYKASDYGRYILNGDMGQLSIRFGFAMVVSMFVIHERLVKDGYGECLPRCTPLEDMRSFIVNGSCVIVCLRSSRLRYSQRRPNRAVQAHRGRRCLLMLEETVRAALLQTPRCA